MVHTWFLDKYTHFALMYTTHHVFPVYFLSIGKYQPQLFTLKLLVLNIHTYTGNAYIEVHILPTL